MTRVLTMIRLNSHMNTSLARRLLSTSSVRSLKEMTGLEQMQYFQNYFRDKAGIGKTLGFTCELVEEGRVVFSGRPDESVYNPIGTVHGGYAATLLDSACACACHSLLPVGKTYTTLDLNISYLAAMTSKTGIVRAEGTVIRMGRQASFAKAELKDEAGKIIATATSTLLIMSPNK